MVTPGKAHAPEKNCVSDMRKALIIKLELNSYKGHNLNQHTVHNNKAQHKNISP
jgi:hypothetical protein